MQSLLFCGTISFVCRKSHSYKLCQPAQACACLLNELKPLTLRDLVTQCYWFAFVNLWLFMLKNIHFRDITIHDTTLVSRMQESEHVREEMMSVCGLYCHVTRMFYTHVFMY